MDQNLTGTFGASDERVQDSPSSMQVATEVDTYEDIVANTAPTHVTPATYSAPELLIRTFQGQLDAMMVEHERMRQQLSLDPTLCRLGKFNKSRSSLYYVEYRKSWIQNLLLENHSMDCEFHRLLRQHMLLWKGM